MKITAVFEGSNEMLNEVSVHITDEKGIETRKVLHMSEFLGILEDCATGSEMLHIGELPEGFYDGAISQEETTFRLAVLVPAGVRPLNYFGDMYMVPFPALMFTFVVTGGSITRSKVFALDTDVPNDKSVVYHYPYGNVYGEGKICWGTNHLERISKKKDINSVVALFFGSETNNDLFRTGKYPTQRMLLEEMKTAKTFPRECLLQHEDYPLLEDVLEEVR